MAPRLGKTASAILAHMQATHPAPYTTSDKRELLAAESLVRHGLASTYVRDETVHFRNGSMVLARTYYRLTPEAPTVPVGPHAATPEQSGHGSNHARCTVCQRRVSRVASPAGPVWAHADSSRLGPVPEAP